MGRACGTYGGGGRRVVYRVLMRECEGKRQLGGLSSILEDNIKMDLQ